MGACVSAPPQCKNACGRESAELCYGYCKHCYRNGVVATPRNNAPQPRPASATRASAPPPTAGSGTGAGSSSSSSSGSGGKEAPPMPTPVPMRGPGAYEASPGTYAEPSPPPYEAQAVPGGPDVFNYPQQSHQQQQPQQQQQLPVVPHSSQPPLFPISHSSPVASIHAPVVQSHQAGSYGSGVAYSPPNYGPSGIPAHAPSPYTPDTPAMQMLPPVMQQQAHRPYQSQSQQQRAPAPSLPQANVACPQCQRALYLPPSQTAARCPDCNAAFSLPGAPGSHGRPVLLVQQGGYYGGAGGGGYYGGGSGYRRSGGIGVGGVALGVGAGLLASAALGSMFR